MVKSKSNKLRIRKRYSFKCNVKQNKRLKGAKKLAFEELIGNEQNKILLNNVVNKNSSLHSYMFIGESGIGKYRFAKSFAKMLLCQDENSHPCRQCKSCLEFDNGNNPDYFEIMPDGSSIKVETVRQTINRIIEKPIISNRKVYIIDDSDTMTVEAQNTLLKTLEEPPEYVSIILIVQNESKILNTIKSRCTKIMFGNIEDSLLKNYLEENDIYINISDNLLKSFNGSIGKALNIRENAESYERLEEIFSNIENIKKIDIINSSNIIYKMKDNIYDILEYINIIFWNSINANTNSPKIQKYINCISQVNDTKVRLDGNSNFDMTIDNMLFSIWEEINE